jgi:hypothetical protein
MVTARAAVLVLTLTTGCGFPVLPVRGNVNDQSKTPDCGVDAVIL